MSSSNLVVNFVHNDLCLKDGLRICPVDQMKISFKGVKIYKKEGILLLAAKQCKL